MDRYKQKSLKFSYNEVSRDSRHAETLKARESSRFKRLSILRSLNEDSINENKTEKPVKPVECKEKKKPVSRLEMLFKWKQEKQIKKELEKKNIKKPFYAGSQSSKSSYCKNLSSVGQPNIACNTSKIAKSRLVTPSTSIQSSRIPNHSRINGAKNANGTKMDAVPTKKPTKALGNSVVSKAYQGAIPTAAKDKIDNHDVKSTSCARNGNFLKTNNQASFLPKPNFSKQPSKPASKTGIPSFSSTLSKGIPAQKNQNREVKKPVTSINKKTEPVPFLKPHGKMAPTVSKNVTAKKKECFSTTATNKQEDIKKIDAKTVTSKMNLMKKNEKKDKSDINTLSIEVESLFEQSLESIPNTIFDCDVSIIKPAPSFAPTDFKFVPPVGLPDLFFDDEAFQRIKMKFISRTSTPTKLCKESSPETSCIDSPANKVNLSQKMMASEPQAAGEKGIPDESISKENTAKKETDSNLNDVLKNPATEEECKKESDVKYVSDLTNRGESLPREGDNKPAVNELPKVTEDVCIDSPLITVDLNKIREIAKRIETMKLEEEELSDIDLLEELDADKCIENKLLSAPPKRASMLKNIPVLNSIAEIAETDEGIVQTPTKSSKSKQNCAVNPRCSQRLSTVTIMEKSPISGITVTPRRSVRLQNIAAKRNQFGEKEDALQTDEYKSRIVPRRSIRLIDLNTPEKDIGTFAASKTNITIDFQRLHLTDAENTDPGACLLDLNSPTCGPKSKKDLDAILLDLNSPTCGPKSRKISLLYSPEKNRKSIRKSIKGDLISFSPRT